MSLSKFTLFTLHNTKNIAYHITEVLIFHADKLTVMGNSKNLRVLNFENRHPKNRENLTLMKYTFLQYTGQHLETT